MPRQRDSGQPPKISEKDVWLAEFVTELVVRLRPEFGIKHARRIAVNEWEARKGADPIKAAAQWAAEQDARRTSD
jgi:hypothetical protein